MRTYKKIAAVILSLIFCLSMSAQRRIFEEKVDIGNGLFKVKLNNRWGLVDKYNNLRLSAEYNEPLFMNGYAVLTEYGTKRLRAIVDMDGNYKEFPPYYINTAYPFVSDGMLAVRESPVGNWGFMDIMNGELLHVRFNGFKAGRDRFLKSIGINGKGVDGTFVFDFVAPFTEGIAAVHTERTGWHHIDRNGQEHFRTPGALPAMFRSSLYNGNAIVFDYERGIIICRETPNREIGDYYIIAEEFELKDYSKNLREPYVINTYGSKLILNHQFQADRYENAAIGDTLEIIVHPKVVYEAEEPEAEESTADAHRFILERDISVALASKTVSAGSKGTATISLKISNNSEFNSDKLSVAIDVNGTIKSWEGTIAANETQQIYIYVPAKFSAASISRDVDWAIKSGKDNIAGVETVSIRRYKPSRR